MLSASECLSGSIYDIAISLSPSKQVHNGSLLTLSKLHYSHKNREKTSSSKKVTKYFYITAFSTEIRFKSNTGLDGEKILNNLD